MSKPTTILMILALALTVAWSSVTVAFNPAAPHDIKGLGVYVMGDDVSEAGLAALDAAVPGVGVPCVAGVAGPYTCSNVDLLGLVPLAEMGGAAGNDSWGWTAEDGTEIAIAGTGRNTAFIDVTDPTSPVVIGQTPNVGGDRDEADGALWRDVKVANDHAFIVSERGGGIQIVDLNALVANPGLPTTVVEPVTVFTGGTGNLAFDGFHNIVANDETDRLYPVGVDQNGFTSMFIVDVADPVNPQIIGLHTNRGPANNVLITHDAQCVVYRGPDTDYNGNNTTGDADGNPDNGDQAEVCFTYDEDEINIVDVTNPTATRVINSFTYDAENGGEAPGTGNGVTGFYAHQGWATPDHQFLVFNDELDELNTYADALTGGTTTYMIEIADLDATFELDDVQIYKHDELATDHNLYIKGDLIFEANYTAGLRVLRYTAEGLRTGDLEEVGFFDVDPGVDAPGFSGAWNVYPFFESGTIIVSSLDEGTYTLRFNDPAGDDNSPDLGVALGR